MTNKIFLFVILFVVAGGLVYFFYTKGSADSNFSPLLVQESQAAVPDETVVNDAGQGKFNLVMKKSKDNVLFSYQFHVLNLETKTDLLLYEDKVSPEAGFDAPLNSFSPDDKQLFIRADSSGSTNYYVFNTDGSEFGDGQKFLNVAGYWEDSKNKLRIRDVTGWAGKDLLNLRTLREDGSDGPSYWFVISSRKFMQLAH